MTASDARGLRDAWALLVAGFSILFVVVGGGIDTVSVFLNALAESKAWSRSSLSAGVAVGVVCAGLATPLAGVLVDRFGVRVPIALGSALLACGFGILWAMDAPWHFVAANAVLGPGFACAAMLPITIAVTVRVPQRTALALGVVATGSSAGALALAPAVQAFVDAVGWRTTYLALGAAVVATPLLFLPALPRGRLVRGAAAPGSGEIDTNERLSLARELRRPGVPALAALLVVPGVVNFGLQVHLVPLLAGAGHATALAASALGAAIGVSAIGKLAGGWLGDRFGALRALRLALVLDAAAVALLPFAASRPLLGAFVLLHGLAVGTEVAVTPVIALAVLGSERFATLYGLLQLGATVAIGVAPIVPGVVFDASGSYGGALLFWLATILVGVAIAFAMRNPAARAGDAAAAALAPAPSPPAAG